VVLVSQPGRQSVHLEIRSELVLGRDCEGLLLADPEVSRRHLELRPKAGVVFCSDLGSTNGTFVNGKRLDGPVALDAEVVVTIGSTTIRLADQPSMQNLVRPGATVIVDSLRQTSIERVVDVVTAEHWAPRAESGTLTILFSDIESSTERVFRIGDSAWFELLEIHNEVFRDELDKARGREIKAQGDGFMLTFPSVRGALGFASTVQKRLTAYASENPEQGVRVRMGLHTGEVITDASGDLFGQHVNKAARIANLAAGGQILVSATVREIASGDSALDFGEAMSVELKGLDGEHVIHEVFWQ
jgi:class 3 adenylate cyclase